MEIIATRPPEVASQIGITSLPKNSSKLEIAASSGPYVVKLGMDRILQYMRDGRNLGPLSVLLVVVIYSLLSSHLPTPIHDCIYHIVH